VHAAGPAALAKRGAALQRINVFLDQARGSRHETEPPPPIASEGIVAGLHAVIHSRLATRADGFHDLLPELMYFAVLPYFGSTVAAEEMAAARNDGL